MKAKQVIATVEIICPKCAEAIAEPGTGSHQWAPCQITPKVFCHFCNKEYEVSKKVNK